MCTARETHLQARDPFTGQQYPVRLQWKGCEPCTRQAQVFQAAVPLLTEAVAAQTSSLVPRDLQHQRLSVRSLLLHTC